MPINDLGEVVLPEFAEGLGKVVDDEAVVVGEELGPHLRDFPARKVEVESVDERHVVANDVRHLTNVPVLMVRGSTRRVKVE